MQQMIYLELTEDGKRLTIDGDLGLLGHLVRTFENERKTEPVKPPINEPKQQPTPAGKAVQHGK